MGGAQKQLYVVAMHLAQRGHQVTIVCTRREPDVTDPFYWHENAQVIPVFRFKQPYPEPYATPIYNIANAIQDIGDFLAQADVFYSHDGGFIFPYVYQTTPAVVSLRSVIFSETLQSAFLFQGDDLILISEYQRDVILNSVGRFFPDLADRTHVIYNGLDFKTFQQTPPHGVMQHLPDINPAEHAIVLFPHRPEVAKGILDAIEVARRLVHTHGIHYLRVLVPRWLEEALSPADKAFYDNLTQRLQDYDLIENFVFHPWISQSQIPQYYTLGDVTLAIGSYVETFGNVPYESLACGTPAIVARVGPARELLSEDLIHKVNVGDVDAAAEIAARIIQDEQRTPSATMQDLKNRFQHADMVATYADVILNAHKRDLMPYVHTPITHDTRFIAAPWTFQTDDGRLYHDLNAYYTDDPTLVTLYEHLQQSPAGANNAQNTVDWDQWLTWYRDGWIVPLQK